MLTYNRLLRLALDGNVIEHLKQSKFNFTGQNSDDKAKAGSEQIK